MDEIQQSAQTAPTAQVQGISKEEAVRKLQEAQARRTAPPPQPDPASVRADSAATSGSGQQPSPQAQATQEDKQAVKEVQQAAASGDQDSFARQFAALTRQQRQLFAQQEAMKKDMAEIENFRKRQELKKTDITKYLEEEGLDPDSVLKAYLNKGEGPQPEDRISTLEKKIADYEARIARDQEEARQRAEQAKEQAAIDTFKKQMNDFIKSKPEQFETILASEEFDRVFDEINKHYDTTGELLDFQVAADKIENELFEKAKKFTSLKKLSSFLAAGKEAPKDSSQQPETPQRQSGYNEDYVNTTITSDFVPVSGSKPLETLDGEELKRRAIEKLMAKQKAFAR